MSGLSQQEYYLVKIAEEAAEVSKNIMKALRFGMSDTNPRKPEDGSNKEKIESEILDLLVAINEAGYRGYLKVPEIPPFEGYQAREERLLKYMRYSRDLGRVQ